MKKEKVERFEDLVAWQKARELTKEIYSITNEGAFGKDFTLRDQIRRACISIMTNIAENFDRGGRAEFHHFLVVSKASSREVCLHLYVIVDAGYLTNDLFLQLFNKIDELSRIVNGLRTAIQKQRGKR